MTEPFDMVAKTLAGLEDVLAGELVQLGAGNVRGQLRAVSFTGDNEMMYRANYCLRTALKILRPVYRFRAGDPEILYRRIMDFNWQSLLSVDQTFAIDALTFSSRFSHSGYVALKVKDAIADQFRDRTGRRPDVDTRSPDLLINVHIHNEQCTVSLDSSGESLHKRGYRQNEHEAPLNEVLAAGMVLLSGWKPGINLFDPMCGSGTILIEAGLMAAGIAPGFFRKNFGFQQWHDYRPGLFEKMIGESSLPGHSGGELLGPDRSARTVSQALSNVRNANLQDRVKVRKVPFEEIKPPWPEGMIIMNPPYGERMEAGDIAGTYKTIGDILKNRFPGYEAWIISANLDALKKVELHPSKKIRLFNGPLECRFQKYTLYRGSKKELPDKSNNPVS